MLHENPQPPVREAHGRAGTWPGRPRLLGGYWPWLALFGLLAAVATALALLQTGPVRPGAVSGSASAWVVSPTAHVGAASPVPLPGAWFAVANGDRVQSLLREGATLWAATTGGVVQWDLTAGTYRQYLSPQDGLPASDVRALAREPSGALWAATARGLARYDAGERRWHAVVSPPGLGSAVTALAAPAPDRLWVGFEQTWDEQGAGPDGQAGAFVGGGLALMDPGTGQWLAAWRSIDPQAEEGPYLPSDNVTALVATADGLIWVGTRPYYDWRTDGCVSPPCEGQWAPHGGGLAALNPVTRRWSRWGDASDTCLSDTITGLAADRAGRAWVGTRGDGLQAFRLGQDTVACGAGHTVFKRSVAGQPLPGTKIWSVAAGDDGRIYVGVGSDRGQGIAVLDHHGTFGAPDLDDEWRVLGLDDVTGPVEPLVSALDVTLGEIVAGTVDSRDDRGADGYGLKVRAPSGGWRSLTTAANGLPGNRVSAVLAHPTRGEVWFGTTGRGVARWDGTRWQAWRAYERAGIGATLAVTSAQRTDQLTLALDLAGYAAAFPGARPLARLGLDDPVIYALHEPTAVAEGVRVRVFPSPQASFPQGAPVYRVTRGPAGDQVTALAVGAEGRLWLGARSGLARRPDPALGETDCDDLPATAALDCRWDGGLSVLEADGWTTWEPEVGGLPSREVQAVALDRGGSVWVGTGGPFGESGRGASVLAPSSGAWTHHTRATRGAGFGFDNVTGVAVDPVTGQVWLASQGRPTCPTAAGKADDCPGITGAVSRWDGRAWQAWTHRGQPPSPALADQGAMTVLALDRGRGLVWAGGWSGERNFHWNNGTGLTASLDACPRDCSAPQWSGVRWPAEGAVFAVAVAGDGRLWTGGHRNGRGIVPPTGGVRLWAGTDWTVHNASVAPLPSNAITALAASASAMWIGTWDRGAIQWLPPNLDWRAYLPSAQR